MARSGSLSRRIERLLNDSSFRQAFAGTRRGLVALALVPVALFAATALVRVEAAGQQTPEPPPAVQPAAPAAVPGAVALPQEIAPEPSKAPELAEPEVPEHSVPPAHVAVAPAPAHIQAPLPTDHVSVSPHILILPGAPTHSLAVIAPAAPGSPRVLVVPHLAPAPPHASLAIISPPHAGVGEGVGYGRGVAQNEHGTVMYSSGRKSGYRYYASNNGDSYAILRGNDKDHMTFSGNWIEGRREQLDKARQQAGGKDILWFTHEGKSYFIDDPAVLAQIEAMYKPMEDLGRQQEELGKKQEALGKQQEELGHQQEQASVPTPDMSKQIAEIEEAMAKLKASQGKTMTQDQFAELQEKLGDLQGRLGEIQGEIGSKQGEFGARMGELGSKMGALGEQMGKLGEQQGKIAQQADQKVKSIIDESLKSGKAHPVQ